MNPLVWLSLPVLVTVVAAVILTRRERQAPRDDDEQLARVRRALGPGDVR